MKAEYFIARRIFRKSSKGFTNPIINISVGSVALGIAVLVLSFGVLKGFQFEIREKIIGFGSHIQITNYDDNNSYELTPLEYDTALVSKLRTIPGIAHVQPFGIKAGIIKTDDQIEGIVLKGVNPSYNWDFFSQKIIEGTIPSITDSVRSNEIIISKQTAKRLNFMIGDRVILYFVQDPPRYRSFEVSGIYETGLAEFDETFIFGDIRHIAKLNDWDSTQISGYEVLVSNFGNLDKITEDVNYLLPVDLLAKSIKERNPQLFGWLSLMDQNVLIILIITLLVALIHMTSILLIVIIERTRMIGILKALGMNNVSLQKLFLHNSAILLIKGIAIGNIIAIGIGLIQKHTGLIKLNQESYYLDTVPIKLFFTDLLLINGGVLIIVVLIMLLPSLVIRRIAPVRAIQYS